MQRNLSDLFVLWLKEPSMKNAGQDTLKHIRRAFKVLLHHLGFATLTLKPTEYYEFLKHLELEQFFQSIKSRLVREKDSELQSDSGLSAEFWIDGIRKLYNEAVDSKNSQTTKNPSAALGRFTCFLVHRPEWNLLCPLDIPLICPPSLGKDLPKTYPNRKYERYGLPREEWPQQVHDELEELKKFWATGGEEAWEELQEERQMVGEPLGSRPEVSSAKLKTIEDLFVVLNLWFGWQVSELKIPKTDLALESLLNPILVRKFNRWQRKRERSCSIAINVLKIGIVYAKKKNFAKTKRPKWQDVFEVLDLQNLKAEFVKQYEIEKQKSTERKKPSRDVSHVQLEQMQNHLTKRCAPFTQYTDSRTKKNRLHKRTKSAILKDHLIRTLCAFMTFTPVRQQQIRTAAEEESLLRRLDKEGQLSYILYSLEHKLERHTNKPHVCILPRNLVPVLDAWIKTYRPLAEQAVESLENWLDFWGYKPDVLQKLQVRLKQARQGHVSKHVKNIQAYIQGLKVKIGQIVQRIKALPQAQANLQSHNYCFFSLGGSRPESFGKPLSVTGLTNLIARAMAEASKTVLGKVYRITPHVFRYIAALHIRRIKGDINLLCKVMNQSFSTSEEYAEKARNLIDDAVDAGEWWVAVA